MYMDHPEFDLLLNAIKRQSLYIFLPIFLFFIYLFIFFFWGGGGGGGL